MASISELHDFTDIRDEIADTHAPVIASELDKHLAKIIDAVVDEKMTYHPVVDALNLGPVVRTNLKWRAVSKLIRLLEDREDLLRSDRQQAFKDRTRL